MNALELLVTIGSFVAYSAQAAQNSVLCFSCNTITINNTDCFEPPNCQSLLNCSIEDTKLRVACYSEFLDYSNVTSNIEQNNLTGIRRGCFPLSIEDNSYIDHCSQYPDTNVIRVSCQTCNTSGCNTHTFDSNGHITGPGRGLEADECSRSISIIPSILMITSSLLVSHIELQLS